MQVYSVELMPGASGYGEDAPGYIRHEADSLAVANGDILFFRNGVLNCAIARGMWRSVVDITTDIEMVTRAGMGDIEHGGN